MSFDGDLQGEAVFSTTFASVQFDFMDTNGSTASFTQYLIIHPQEAKEDGLSQDSLIDNILEEESK